MLRYISSIILAGGKSSRFDIPKAFIKKKNIYFLDKIIFISLDAGFFLSLSVVTIKTIFASLMI